MSQPLLLHPTDYRMDHAGWCQIYMPHFICTCGELADPGYRELRWFPEGFHWRNARKALDGGSE